MIRRFSIAAALLAAALGWAHAPASAQSLFNAAGLGVPSDPLDARTRALGGVGIGLTGPALLGSDPAAAAEFGFPTVSLTARPSWVEFLRTDGEEGSFRGTRFPSLGVAYPAVLGVVATLSVESHLDQRYEVDLPGSVAFGDTPVEVTDEFTSTGGVSLVRLGVARRLGRSVAVGISGGRYAGSLTRRLVRTFGEGVDEGSVESFQAGGFWGYSGTSLAAGASWTLGTVGRVAGSLTWSSGLDAEASDDTDGASGSFDLPLQVRLGASAALAPGLSLSASWASADWSAVGADLRGGSTARASSSYGAGVELSRATLLGRSAPLRVGYRRTALPFGFGAGDAAETAWSGGLGLNLAQSGPVVLSVLDVAVERGTRKDDALTERFWRGTLTVRVSGY